MIPIASDKKVKLANSPQTYKVCRIELDISKSPANPYKFKFTDKDHLWAIQ